MEFSRMFHSASEAEVWLKQEGIEYLLKISQRMPRPVYRMNFECKAPKERFKELLDKAIAIDKNAWIDDMIIFFEYPTNFGLSEIVINCDN
jgi:hypothetical protein